MGVDAHRKAGDEYEGNEYFRANWRGWSMLLIAAGEGGWVPAGTVRYDEDGVRDGGWDGDYDTNDGQYVTPEDAAAMANAIESMRGKSNLFAWHPEFADEFIAYCRGGGFEIH